MSIRICVAIAISVLSLGLMILAQVLDYHFAVVIVLGVASGSIIAVLFRRLGKAWVGAALGVVAAFVFLLLYHVLWLLLSLPPYLEKDF